VRAASVNLPQPSAAIELFVLLLVAWAAFAAIPLALGGIGLSWDALNHQVYLGWTADRPRFDRDFLAASYQSFQFPYLYWPLFKLFQSGISGAWAGVVLVSFNVLAVPPLWIAARQFVADDGWYGLAMRWLAVALGFMTGAVLSLFDSTANDLMAAIPLAWAIALALEAWDIRRYAWLTIHRLVLLSGLCSGIAVAFKLSNGPLVLLMPLLWILPARSARARLLDTIWGCAAILAGFVLCYGYWGAQLWHHYGNPIYPFYDHWFAHLRGWLGWHQP
jgi:hypothetical protein